MIFSDGGQASSDHIEPGPTPAPERSQDGSRGRLRIARQAAARPSAEIYGQIPLRPDLRVMFKGCFLAWSGCLLLLLASCAGPDGKVTTSTPTGPGVTESGNTGTTVETVPSGLEGSGRVTTPLTKEGPAARAAASAEGEPQPGR